MEVRSSDFAVSVVEETRNEKRMSFVRVKAMAAGIGKGMIG